MIGVDLNPIGTEKNHLISQSSPVSISKPNPLPETLVTLRSLVQVSMRNFDMLPSDAILEILSRLPIESALDCKLVSKPWKNLIQHPSFSEMHFNHHLDSSGKLSLLVYESVISEDKLFRYTYAEYDENLNCFSRRTRINLRPPFNHCRVLGSCNGLICFNVSFDNNKMDSHGEPFDEPAYICNPVTREYVVLPKFEGNELLYGFRYVPLTNEYKVVRILNNIGRSWRDPNLGIVQIYTLGSGIGWRNAEKKMDYNVNRCYISDQFIGWMGEELLLPSIWLMRSSENFQRRLIFSEMVGFDLWVLKKNQNYHDVCIWSKEFSNILWHDKPITFAKSGGLLCRDERDNNAYRYAPEASSSRILVNINLYLQFLTGTL